MKNINDKMIVGKFTLKNRLVLPPMASATSGEQDTVTDKMINYYSEMSKDIGLTIVEHSYISPEGKAHQGQLSISKEDDVEGLSKLANAIQKNGAKAIIQLSHAGSVTSESVTGYKSLGASKLADDKLTPDIVMTTKDIANVVNGFRLAAKRAMMAGFDGVELHSAHKYLLNQFYSPITNKRSDEYGGAIENRIRLHLEIIKSVREEIGKDKLILLRLGALDYMENGSLIEDAVCAAIAFEKAGVDILDVSGGLCGYMVKSKAHLQGYFSVETKEMKKHISIPVISTGGITNSDAAEKLINSDCADLIGIGRVMKKDPMWASKVLNKTH
ncbi:NADH:flavin oxidoreductase [Chakrabartyella piscis]|uniref:NADH:flavin oxidoreductase n=1 Tax=Chakrabartyella piscis TaxID=2918914 RepID=UPI002958D122|nr:NADH:flavin oxidoreductase [Chakrabartyella piscis]